MPEYLEGLADSAGASARELVPRVAHQDPLISETVKALVVDVESGYFFGPTYGEALCAALLAQLIRYYSVNGRTPRTSEAAHDAQREWVRSYVLDQLDKHVTLAELARLLQMDVFSLTRWFKKAFGVPPHKFIMRARIGRAQEMLKRNDVPLVDVALRCGFCSQSHFATAFRRDVGVSPSAFRASFVGRD